MNSRHSPFVSGRNRGSVLLVSLLFSAVIAISLGSFLLLANNASKLSYRTYHLGVGMNLAETGLEQAMWSINRAADGDADAWKDWTAVGSDYRRTFDLGKLEGGSTAQVKVYARSGVAAPMLIARAIVTPPQGAPIEKWIKVTLSRRSRFAVGGLGREGIKGSGNNVYFASWNSNPDKDDSTLFIPYSDGVKNDKMSLATSELDAELNSGQADVNGKAAVASNSLDDIKVGPNGYIGPFGTAEGTKDPNSVSTDFTADLDIPVFPSSSPTSVGAITTDMTLPLDADYDASKTDQTYYYYATELTLNNETLTIKPGTKVVLNVERAGGVDVGGGSGSLAVGGTLTTDTTTGVTTYLPAQLEIYTAGNVSISGKGAANEITQQTYTPGSKTTTVITTTVKTTTEITQVKKEMSTGNPKTLIGWSYKKKVTTVTTVGSNSPTTVVDGPNSYYLAASTAGATEPVEGTTTVTNSYDSDPIEKEIGAITTVTGTMTGQPKSLFIYGTRTAEEAKTLGNQTFKISGNGSLSGVVYAPYADISANGGGNAGFIYGSLVGASLTFTGNDNFYYDESLGEMDDGGRFGIDNWDELVGYADRGTYGSLMNF